MEMFYGMIVLGLATLAAPYLAKLAGYETHRKPFDLVGVSGVFFLLAASFKLSTILMTTLVTIGPLLMMISFALGWLGLLVGAFWAAGEVLRESNQGILSGKA